MWSGAFKSVNFSKGTPLKLRVLFKLSRGKYLGVK